MYHRWQNLLDILITTVEDIPIYNTFIKVSQNLKAHDYDHMHCFTMQFTEWYRKTDNFYVHMYTANMY